MIPSDYARMPKLDLHCHLDGSLPLAFMSERLGRTVLASEVQAPDNCANLTEYLTKFETPLACLQDAEGMRGAGYAVLQKAAAEHIRYIELRFAPLLSAHDSFTTPAILEALLDGLAQGQRDFSVHFGVIVCAMRHMDPDASLRMIQQSLPYTDKGVVAADLAGDENAFPMSQFMDLFAQVRRMDLPFTIHAGEQGSTQNIIDALEAGAARIGHGIAMAGHPELIERVREAGVGVETCPISNRQTKATSLENHPISEFLQAGVLATVNTDNRTVSNTTVTKDLLAAGAWSKLASNEQVLQTQRNAISCAFAPHWLKDELHAELDAFIPSAEPLDASTLDLEAYSYLTH